MDPPPSSALSLFILVAYILFIRDYCTVPYSYSLFVSRVSCLVLVSNSIYHYSVIYVSRSRTRTRTSTTARSRLLYSTGMVQYLYSYSTRTGGIACCGMKGWEGKTRKKRHIVAIATQQQSTRTSTVLL